MIITNFNKLGFSGSVDIITEYVPPSQTEFTTPGTYTWVAPKNVNNVCAVCVGGGGGGSVSSVYSGTNESGGGGGGLGWKNNIRVLPGQTYTVVVGNGGRGGFFPATGNYNGAGGESSWFIDSGLVLGGGGGGVANASGSGGGGAGYVGDGGGNGGSGGSGTYHAGAGGAGGYSGNGGNGGNGFFTPVPSGNGFAGAGGGGGGGSCGGYNSLIGGAGGGVGIYGEGANGGGGTAGSGSFRGGAGGGGSNGGGGFPHGTGQFTEFVYTSANYPETTFQMGGYYGGGGAGAHGSYPNAGRGGPGAVRIIWKGTGDITRVFPATNAGNL